MANLIDEIKQRVGATQIEMAKYVKIAPTEKENVSRGWVGFGEANMYPQYLIELYNESPVHGSIVNSISQMIAGQGIVGGNAIANQYLQSIKIDSIIPNIARDLKLFGGYYLEVIWSMDRTTIAQVNHLPFENCRLACSDEQDDVTGVWYSRDWSDMRKKKNIPHYIPMFNVDYKEEMPKQVMFVHTLKLGSEYYPKPDYVGSVNYIELTRQIGEYHVNNILNGFFPSLIASFNNGIPSLEEQHMIKNQLTASIQGADNAGKVLTFFNEERDRGVDFTAFPLTDADKQYQFLSEECTKQIMIAHRVTSPLLFGVRDGGGLGSNTDELKTALYIFQKQVIEPYQRLIADSVMEICKASNIISSPQVIPNDILQPEPTEVQQKKKVKCQCTNFLNLGGEGSGCTGDNCGRPSGLSENEKNEVFNLANSTAEKLGLSKNDYHISFGKTPNGLGAYTTFEGTSDGKWVMSPKIVIKDTGDINYQKRIVQHELRHIYQSKEKGFYITKDGIHYENKLHITTKEYNKILNGMSKAKTEEDYLKFKQKYINLPWEKDADNFAGINHEFSSILKDLKLKDLPIDLIELPFKVLEEDQEVSQADKSYEPTDEMAREAELGLKWREEYGRGGTEVGVARARDISNKRNLSFDTVKRMNSYFARHEVDKEAIGWEDGEEGFPTAGRIAWQLWGGDAGRDWAARIVERVNNQQTAHVCQSSNDFTDEEGREWIADLKTKAEYIDDQEWELISEEEVTDPENELNFTSEMFNKMPSMADANGDEKSNWGDAGLYKLRYAYSQNLSANSREFCVEMVSMSVAGAVFRYEDINNMSDKGVNGDFAPTGRSTYDIFVYKGGAFCHHFWKRQIYMRKRDSKGRILPNQGLENDKRVGNNPFVPKKGVEGTAPINTPSRGSLKYG